MEILYLIVGIRNGLSKYLGNHFYGVEGRRHFQKDIPLTLYDIRYAMTFYRSKQGETPHTSETPKFIATLNVAGA